MCKGDLEGNLQELTREWTPPEAKSSLVEWPEESLAASAYKARSTSSRATGTRLAAPACKTAHSDGTAPATIAAALCTDA